MGGENTSVHECNQQKRLEKIESKIDKLYDDSTTTKILLTKLDVTLEQVSKSYDKNEVVMQKISDNLDRLNTKSDKTDEKVTSLETAVDALSKDFKDSESLNIIKIDQRALIKTFLSRYLLPSSGIVGILFGVAKGIGWI